MRRTAGAVRLPTPAPGCAGRGRDPTWLGDRHAALLTLTLIAGFSSTIFLPASQALVEVFGWRAALLVLAGLLAGCALQQAAVFETVAVTVVAVHLVAHLRDTGVAAGAAAGTAGALVILSVTGRIAPTAFARQVGLGRLAALMLGGQALGVAALFALPRSGGLVLFVLLFGAGFGVMTIARAALLGRYVPEHVYASVGGRSGAGRERWPGRRPGCGRALISPAGYGPAFSAVAACSLGAGALLPAAERALH